MTKRLDGKVALITGASSGIGRATALTFAREGAKVVVADVAVDGGEETAQIIRDSGGEAIFVKTDVSLASQVEALINTTVQTYGRLDYAHNNAATGGAVAETHEYQEDDWDSVLGINLKGVWLCMRYQIPQMLRQGGGAIVNTASTGGLKGIAGQPAYTASKHGVNGLTKAAALENAGRGIRVNSVCPGVTYTPMIEQYMARSGITEEMLTEPQPVGRMGTPEEIAEAVVWLCSDAASFVTGHNMTVDGGKSARA